MNAFTLLLCRAAALSGALLVMLMAASASGQEPQTDPGPAFELLPTTKIEALADVFNPGERAQLVASLAHAGGARPVFTWNAVQAGEVIATGEGAGFSFDTPPADPDDETTASIVVSLVAQTRSWTARDVKVLRVNTPPAGGRVVLLPPQVVGGSLVEARAVGFEDPDRPLSFQFFLEDPMSGFVLPLTTRGPSARMQFPAPRLAGEMRVVADVEDALGQRVRARFPLQILADDAPLEPVSANQGTSEDEQAEEIKQVVSPPEYPGGSLEVRGVPAIVRPGRSLSLRAQGAAAFERTDWRVFLDGRRTLTATGPTLDLPIPHAWAGRVLAVEASGRTGAGAEKSASAEGRINAPPLRGRLEVAQVRVRAGAVVGVTAAGYADQDTPLSYTFRLASGAQGAQIFADGPRARLWTPQLPAGAPDRLVRLDVTVTDAVGDAVADSLVLVVQALPAR